MENKLTYKEYTLSNGETIKCTVAFSLLLKLRTQNKRVYDELNAVLINGLKEVMDAANALYGAYLCACYAGENGGSENAMNKDTFFEALGDDVTGVALLCGELITKKKN